MEQKKKKKHRWKWAQVLWYLSIFKLRFWEGSGITLENDSFLYHDIKTIIGYPKLYILLPSMAIILYPGSGNIPIPLPLRDE